MSGFRDRFHGISPTHPFASNAALIPLQIDNQDNTKLQYEGTWMTQRDAQIPNRASPKPYRETSMYRSNVSLTFNQAIAIAINGPRNWGHWVYNVVSAYVSRRRPLTVLMRSFWMMN